jgi:ABC-2 type transport system ATP-binding protein
MVAIVCKDLTYIYRNQVVALDHLNLEISQRITFGLLGENGAGKSTLVRLIMGFIFPTSGKIEVLGTSDMASVHQKIGHVHEQPLFTSRFTGLEYLTYLGELSGITGKEKIRRAEAMLDLVDLRTAGRRRTGTYSKGMLQRLAIAQAIYHDPELLILDEPTSGLDPRSQWEVRQIIARLRREGKSILLCSHYLAEVEALCDSVAILRQGKVLLQGDVASLLSTGNMTSITFPSSINPAHIASATAIAAYVCEITDDAIHISAENQSTVLAALLSMNVPILALNPLVRSLEDIYVTATAPGRLQEVHS